jgi:lipopolysaccharide transport system permease protein
MSLLFAFSLGGIISKNSSLGIPYPLFALSGLMIWNIFSSGISNAGNSMVTNANIIKKVYFPRLIIPFAAILVSLFDFFMTLLVFMAALFYYNISIDIFHLTLFLSISVFTTIIATLGLGCLLAALNIKYRDFRYIIPFLVQGMLFLTPIIYPISLINNEKMKSILAINPMYAPIEFIRHAISNQDLNFSLISMSLCSSIILLFIGIFYFRKTESYFADIA